MKTSALFTLISLTLTINLSALTMNFDGNVAPMDSDATFVAFLEVEEEAPMALEDWMLDVSVFDIETEMEVEPWMLDVEAFEIEPSVQIEPWMVDVEAFENEAYPNKFRVDKTIFEEYEETNEVKSWMLDVEAFVDEAYGREDIKLEAWMVDVNAF